MELLNTLKELISISIAGLAFPGFNFHVKPGLYPIGNPSKEAPILITSNYFVTFKRVIASLKKQAIIAWLLVVDTKGVNVWCSAAGRNFTAERVISQITKSNLSKSVSHSRLILPQLSAAGIDHVKLKQEGWDAKFGPIDIKDIGEYLSNNCKKNPTISQVRFPVQKRIENAISHNVFITLILLPLILLVNILANPIGFLRPWSEWLLPNAMFLFVYIWVFGLLYSILYSRIPFKSGFLKGLLISIPFVPICVFIFFTETTLDFILGIGTLFLYSTVISTDFDGYTPIVGMDFFEKDLILLALSSVIIVLIVIIAPLIG